jgi:DNA-binding MarR family transcriptional regulator
MGKQKIVFLTDEEIKAVANMCRTTIKMAKDSKYFEGLVPEAESVLRKMKEKIDD